MTTRPAAALVLTVAPPGAGKSTWVAKHFPLSQRVSLDHLRWVVCGDQADQTATPAAVRLMHEILEERMARGLMTVLDSTAATAEARDQAVGHAIRWSVPAVAVVLHTPLEVCLARQVGRERPGGRWPNGRAVPADVIREKHARIVEDIPKMRWGGIWVAAHLGVPGGDCREGQVPRHLRPALPWLADLPERWLHSPRASAAAPAR